MSLLDFPQFLLVRNLSAKAVMSLQVMMSRKGNLLMSLDISCILMYQGARTWVKSKFTFEVHFPSAQMFVIDIVIDLNFKVTCPFIWGLTGYYMLEQ